MTRESLQKYRVIVPGTLIVLAAASVLAPRGNLLEGLRTAEWKDLTPPALLVLVTGTLYRLFDVREFLVGDFWRSVNSNIQARLLSTLRLSRQVTTQEEVHLRAHGRLMDVFYKIIDNDKTLESRAQGVYLNGLFVTSAYDLAVIAFLCALAHAGGAMIRDEIAHLWWSLSLVGVGLFARWVMVPAALRKHKRLSNEQLNVIETHHRADVERLCEAALQQLHAPQRKD